MKGVKKELDFPSHSCRVFIVLWELIFKESIRINGDDSNDDDVNADTTVQGKNITCPTDAKLHKKIIKKTLKIVQDEQLPIRQSYTRILKKNSGLITAFATIPSDVCI